MPEVGKGMEEDWRRREEMVGESSGGMKDGSMLVTHYFSFYF